MNYGFAKRMGYLKTSDVREILKVTERPEVISFAGGLPAPELFPIKEILEANRAVLEEAGEKALQYSTTEGFRPLREWIAKRMRKTWEAEVSEDNILITHGSQQALDFTGKVFLDEGDVVLCESPTYLAAISALKAYGCEFVEVPTDNDGMLPEELERLLTATERVKLIYVIPDFQNPTGRTWSLERRKKLVEAAERHGVVIIEDNPYGELRFEGETIPSVKSLDKSGCVICLGTFSKTFCPGYRIGWVAAERDALAKYILAKQAADLQCNTLAQMELAKYLELNDIDQHIAKIREVYRRRRDVMVCMMEAEFPQGVTFTRPQGGLFAWVELPPEVNARDVLQKCITQNVAFVPGGAFFPGGGKENTLRLNFSNMPEERIVEGMKRLASVLKEFIN